MAHFHYDIQQGSAEWYKIRSGLPTAGSFHRIITPAKMQLSTQRQSYACQLIAERLLNWQSASLDHIKCIAEGKRLEPQAVVQLEKVIQISTTPVGFVTTDDGRFGASPDRVAGLMASPNTVVECKCPTIPTQIEYLLFGPGTAYRAQVQGQLWVAEAERAIFYSYLERGPHCLVRTHRDEVFIKAMESCLEQFSDELEGWTERARSLGVWEAFAEIIPPGQMNEQELSSFLEADPGMPFQSNPKA